MPSDITLLILPLVALLVLAVAAWLAPPVWANHKKNHHPSPLEDEEKAVELMKMPWGTVVITSAIFGLAGVAGFHALMPDGVPAPLSHLIIGSGGVLAFMAFMTALTDYTLYKIPKRVTQVAILLGLAFIAILGLATGSIMPLGVAVACLLIPFLLMFTRGIGMGDIRLYVMTALLLPWWMGIQMYVYGLIAGVVVGLISFAVARVAKVGAQKDMKPGAFDKLMFKLRRKPLPERITKRALPFGPAILIGFLLAALWVLIGPEPVLCADHFYTCVAQM